MINAEKRKVIATPESSKPVEEESGGASLIKQEEAADIKEIIRTVTLALTPEQSEQLIFAQEIGKAWLALTPAGGVEEEDTPGRTYLNIID